jgi:tRNA threonylcarbamoyl adenosine modification protein YjeE
MAIIQTDSEAETAALAKKMAAEAKSGDIFLLEGPLGAGKSVFARGFIRALTDKDTDVPSPTFTLVQIYETNMAPLYHFDLYRLNDPEEIYEIGWEEAIAGGIVLVEWPERLGPYLPRKTHRIRIETLDGESRRIAIDEE